MLKREDPKLKSKRSKVGETQQAAPFARQRGEAARLDVDPAVSVGLVLVGRTGLHLGETLISCYGVDLHPSLPAFPLRAGRLQRGWESTDDKNAKNERKSKKQIVLD